MSIPITILMADDDRDDREMTRDALAANDLTNPLEFVGDGDAVLEYLETAGTAARAMPGLILLDLNMPKRDGSSTLAALKADPRLRSIPVIMLTTSKSQTDVDRSYELGACSYITKPVSFDALVALVGTFAKYWLHLVALPRSGVA